MAQTIDTKMMSMKVQKHLDSSLEQQKNSTDRLSSGLRVNSATDDAAGLAIAERMNSMIRGLNTAMRNAYDGISMSQTAEGGLGQVSDTLLGMRDLAVQSANGTISSADREHLDAEFSALNEEISRIASTTMFNGEAVLAGNDRSINYQLGPSADSSDTVSISLTSIDPISANIGTYESSIASIDQIDTMLAEIASARSGFSAMQNRFESTISNLQVKFENQSAARGRIMDADFAIETAKMSHSQILHQAGTALSVQANVSSQSVMNLLA